LYSDRRIMNLKVHGGLARVGQFVPVCLGKMARMLCIHNQI